MKLASASTLIGIVDCIKEFWMREDIKLCPLSKTEFKIQLGGETKKDCLVRKEGKRFYFIKL